MTRLKTLALLAILCVFAVSVLAATQLYDAKLVRVIDGDTVVLDVKLGPDSWKRNLHCRLKGIDTPELHPRRLPPGATEEQRAVRQSEIRRARKAKVALEQLLGVTTGSNTPKGKALRVRLHGKDRYGRALVTLFAGETDVGQWLIREGYATEWHPKRR